MIAPGDVVVGGVYAFSDGNNREVVSIGDLDGYVAADWTYEGHPVHHAVICHSTSM